jgi:hypothetical protein
LSVNSTTAEARYSLYKPSFQWVACNTVIELAVKSEPLEILSN